MTKKFARDLLIVVELSDNLYECVTGINTVLKEYGLTRFLTENIIDERILLDLYTKDLFKLEIGKKVANCGNLMSSTKNVFMCNNAAILAINGFYSAKEKLFNLEQNPFCKDNSILKELQSLTKKITSPEIEPVIPNRPSCILK